MTSFRKIQQRRRRMIDEFIVQTGLDKGLMENVVVYVESVAGQSKEIRQTTFISQMVMQFNMSSSFMMGLIFNAAQKSHKHPEKTLTLEEYCRLICLFISDDLDAKINFVFGCYDINASGSINRTEVYTLLKPTLLEDEEDEDMLKDLIEQVMKAVDRDANGLIDLEEFRELVKKDVLYIEMLGQCLPEDKHVRRFVQKLSNKTTLQVKEMIEAELLDCMVAIPYVSKRDSYYPINLDL